jgi:hypothetical protein
VAAVTVEPLLGLPGVAAAVESARSDIAAVYRHPANRRNWPRTAAAASVRAARASAVLDGGSGALDPDATVIADPVLAGALRVAAATGRLAPVWRRSPLQALAQVHMLASAGLPRLAEPGRPVDRLAADRLTALAAALSEGRWPAPVAVAVVHGEILGRRVFGTADGVVARAAARLTMLSTGLDRRGLTVPEVAHLRSGARYADLIADYLEGVPAGVAAWVVEVCRCLSDGAREAASIADAASG